MERASLAQVAIAGPRVAIAHREDEVADAVARACDLVGAGPPPPPYLLAGAAALTQVGRLEAAEALLLRAPDDPQALLRGPSARCGAAIIAAPTPSRGPPATLRGAPRRAPDGLGAIASAARVASRRR